MKNENSIGIEVVGMAYLKIGEKYYMNLADKKEVSPPPPLSREYLDKNKNKNYWDALTEAQIKSVVCLVKLLMKEFSIPLSMILTHEEIQSKTAGEGQAVKEAIFPFLS
jgi:N-acetyl-anhydromuramyl-L-alanine amidase AmpD